ncbi:hypothetical protein Peur_006856 [Populus x canadensis]
MPPLALFNRNNTNTEEEGRQEKKTRQLCLIRSSWYLATFTSTLYIPNLDTALLLPPSSFLDGEEEPLIVDFLRAQYASAFTAQYEAA